MIQIRNDKLPSELEPNEVIEFTRHEERGNPEKITSWGIIMVCPKCGEPTTGKHLWSRETMSLTPSIVHPCGYHGFLTNGEFINA